MANGQSANEQERVSISGVRSYESIQIQNSTKRVQVPSDDLKAEDYLEKPESPQDYRKRLTSIAVAFAVLFVISIQSTLYFSSLYPYLQTIDPGSNESFFGWILMAYSLAGAISSPIFGWATNRLHGSKIPIMVGLVLNSVGNLLLVFVESLAQDSRKWAIMMARIISGVGAGNGGALFAFTVMASKESERNRILSVRGAITSCAILLGPGIQSAVVPMGYPGKVAGPFRLNMYTAPGYLSAILGISSLLVVAIFFHEKWHSVAEKKNEDGKFHELDMRPYDLSVLSVCCLARFAQVFCFSFDDTVGSPLTMVMFRWTKSEAVLYNGIIVVVMAFLDIFGQLFVGNVVLKYVKERYLILFGLIMMAGYLIIVFPWPGLPPLIAVDESDKLVISNRTYSNNSSDANFVQIFDIVQEGNLASPMAITANASNIHSGTFTCDFQWCSSTTRINFFQYLAAFGFFLISYSAAYTPTATLFSKALGPRKQGTWQGLFSACSLLGMTFGPPIASNLFQYSGPRIMYGVGFVLLIMAIIPVIATFKRLVPWSEGMAKEGAETGDSSLSLSGEVS